jgi:MYXO-CTERM domain-containing protein
MPSMRPVESAIRARPLSALLTMLLALALPVPSFGQASPAVSTIVAFNGSTPNGGIVLGDDGNLYGTSAANTIVAGGLVFRAAPDGSSISTLHQFTTSEGYSPAAGLLLGSDGLLYGTTTLGVATEPNTTGTVFRLAPDGSGFTIIYRFAKWTLSNKNGTAINTDGAYPSAALIEGSDGLLYGTTQAGGPNGTGAVFRLSTDGSDFQLLHAFGEITSAAQAFPATNVDGAAPLGDLLLAADGFLYGTTTSGGTNGRGTIFRLQPDGSGFEVRHTFSQLSTGTTAANVDGASPLVGLTDGEDGLLYGVTSQGGANGAGTAFSFDPNSGLLTTLHDFETSKGSVPGGALLVGTDTKLYGTTKFGGTTSSGGASNLGTLFSIARDGTGFAVLHNFDGENGSVPVGRLLQLSDSLLVGVSNSDGSCGQGTLFQYSSTGQTVDGDTSCGRKKRSKGGGGTTPAVLALLALLGLAGLRRRA